VRPPGNDHCCLGTGVLAVEPAGLQLPRGDDGVFDGVSVAVLEVGDDHHVLRISRRHRERLGERLHEKIAHVEGRADDDVAVVELPRYQAPLVSPFEEPLTRALGDTVELGGQSADR